MACWSGRVALKKEHPTKDGGGKEKVSIPLVGASPQVLQHPSGSSLRLHGAGPPLPPECGFGDGPNAPGRCARAVRRQGLKMAHPSGHQPHSRAQRPSFKLIHFLVCRAASSPTTRTPRTARIGAKETFALPRFSKAKPLVRF